MRQEDKTETALRYFWINGGFGLPTAYENQPFDIPDNAPWAEFWFVPASTQAVTASSYGYDEVVGFVQINLNYPLFSGTKDARETADKIADLFPTGHRLVYNDFAVVPTYVHRAQGKEVNGWWRVPVTIGFYSRLQRLGA